MTDEDLTPETEDHPEDTVEATQPKSVDPADQEEFESGEGQAEPAPDISDSQVYDLIALETDGLDVDEALAAVASLNELVMGQEDEAEAEAQIQENAAEERVQAFQSTSTFPAPPLVFLHRGQMASVVPALLLIAVGAWLTLSLTTTQTAPDPGIMVTISLGGIGLALLSQWMSSGRWARGALFFGADFLLSAGVFFFLWQNGAAGLARGWPLFVVALGAALILTAMLAPAPGERQRFSGIVIGVGGLVGYAVTAGILDSRLVTTIGGLWPVVLVALLVIWGLPVLARSRR